MDSDSKAVDRHEALSSMEPLVIPDTSRHRGGLNDLAFELVQKASAFRSSLPRAMQVPLAGLVRAMNCYYSNLIEGHDTHPIDIERALENDYSDDRKKRDLQLEAKAHMAVQQWIDEGGLPVGHALSTEGIIELHRRFCERLPEEVRAGDLPAQAGRILEAVLHRGEVARGEVDVIAGTGDRQARRILASLVERGVLASEGPRAPLHLAFPASLAHRWMPGLFPERAD